MGKRRKPVRKPNYQSLEQVQLDNKRKAASDPFMQGLLEEMPADRPLSGAYERLFNQAAELNRIDAELQAAGVPASEFKGFQRLQVPELEGDIPAPYVMQRPGGGGERRIHLVEEGGELYPIANNNPNAGDYLVTDFGKNVDLEGETKATEYIQDHILRLMGYDVQRGPKGKVDFYVTKDGERVGIDGQTSRVGWSPDVQAYAKMVPMDRPDGGYGYGYSPVRDRYNAMNTQANEMAIVRDIRRHLDNEMTGSKSLEEAVNNLVNAGFIRDDEWLQGKAFRQDYNEVLMPVLNARDHRNNARFDDNAIAPDEILKYDMDEVSAYVRGIKDRRDLQIVPNAGNNRSGELRGQIKAAVPSSMIEDVVGGYPYAAQMLRTLPYKK